MHKITKEQIDAEKEKFTELLYQYIKINNELDQMSENNKKLSGKELENAVNLQKNDLTRLRSQWWDLKQALKKSEDRLNEAENKPKSTVDLKDWIPDGRYASTISVSDLAALTKPPKDNNSFSWWDFIKNPLGRQNGGGKGPVDIDDPYYYKYLKYKSKYLQYKHK